MKYWLVLSDGASHFFICETAWVRWIDNLPTNSSCPCFINLFAFKSRFFRSRPQGKPLKQNTPCWHKSGHDVAVTFLPAQFILDRKQGLVKKHHLCRYLKSALTHSTPKMVPGKGWRFMGMSLVHGWRMALGFNHMASKLASVEAFIGAKRICKLRAVRKKKDNNFILFIPSWGMYS